VKVFEPIHACTMEAQDLRVTFMCQKLTSINAAVGFVVLESSYHIIFHVPFRV